MTPPQSTMTRHSAATSGRLSRCVPVQARLSEYLDGAVSGIEMRRIADHLGACADCAHEFNLARQMQATLSALGPARPPAELNLRLRLAISHEGERSLGARLGRLSLRWQNSLRPLALQASAGMAGATVLIGSILFLLGAVGTANPVMANDEPLGAMTSPHYLYSMSAVQPIITTDDSTFVVEAAINARGEVYDYRIVSGPEDLAARHEVADRLLSSVFQPASVFGVPVRGHVIMTFAGLSIRG